MRGRSDAPDLDVYQRRRVEVALRVITAPLAAVLFTLLTSPVLLLPIWLLLMRTAGVSAEVAGITAASVSGGLLTLALVGHALHTLRDEVIIHSGTQTVTFRGFVWWSPWWMPHVAPMVVPFRSIRHAERLRNSNDRSWHRYTGCRVVTDDAVVVIPRSMKDWFALTDRLILLSRLTPPPPSIRTARGLQTGLVLLVLLLNAIGIAYVALIFIPRTLP